MKRTRRKRNANSDSVQGRSGERKVVRDALSSEDAENTAGYAKETEAGTGGGSRKQLLKRKGIKNSPHRSAETLLNRYKFDEGLRRGLLQAAKNNSPLPEWLLRRKSFDRAGEFYVRLKAELVAPERRDQAEIKRMMAELCSSQPQDTNQQDGDDADTMSGQGVGQVEEDVDEIPVEQPTKVTHQQLTGDGEHMQSSTKLNSDTNRYYKALRRGLLKAAGNGTHPSGWLQNRSVARLGDFWVRLKAELLSAKRDQPKIERMLDELRASEQQGAETAGDQLVSDAEAEQDTVEEEEEEATSGQQRRNGNDEAVKLRGQHDDADDGSNDAVFVRWPRRRQQQLARRQVEEEL